MYEGYESKGVEEQDQLAIFGVVSAVFDRYARSKPDQLNRTEAQSFIQDTMGGESGEDLLPEAFQDLFSSFDKDGDGFIEKTEMLLFIAENFEEMEHLSNNKQKV